MYTHTHTQVHIHHFHASLGSCIWLEFCLPQHFQIREINIEHFNFQHYKEESIHGCGYVYVRECVCVWRKRVCDRVKCGYFANEPFWLYGYRGVCASVRTKP